MGGWVDRMRFESEEEVGMWVGEWCGWEDDVPGRRGERVALPPLRGFVAEAMGLSRGGGIGCIGRSKRLIHHHLLRLAPLLPSHETHPFPPLLLFFLSSTSSFFFSTRHWNGQGRGQRPFNPIASSSSSSLLLFIRVRLLLLLLLQSVGGMRPSLSPPIHPAIRPPTPTRPLLPPLLLPLGVGRGERVDGPRGTHGCGLVVSEWVGGWVGGWRKGAQHVLVDGWIRSTAQHLLPHLSPLCVCVLLL